jgi:hypothetical protein
MADDVSAVQTALCLIASTPHKSLALCGSELLYANLAIAKALLSHSQSSTQVEGQDIGQSEFHAAIPLTETDDVGARNETQITAQSSKSWLSSPENALVSLAHCWLHTTSTALQERGEREELPLAFRNAVISNSPAVLALLRRFVMKSRRFAKLKRS